ncbi:MAG: MFS transporter [Betaproteobacteria bacterium]|nr:MFS transporter [Betaproteobacteria bacterium]
MDASYLKRIYWRISGITMLLVILALAANSYLSHKIFEAELVPETAKKAVTVGASVSNLILKAVSAGVDYKALYGVDKAFQEVFDSNPEFTFMAATDTSGKILYQAGKAPDGGNAYFTSAAVLARLKQAAPSQDSTLVGGQYMVTLPMATATEPLGLLHIGIDRSFVDRIALEILLDILVVLVVALFFTLELLNFMAGAHLEAGLRNLSLTLARIRERDFTSRVRGSAQDEIGRILQHIDNAVARLNARYQQLTKDLQTQLKSASYGQRAELQGVVAQWEALRARFRFGSASEVATGQEAGLNQIRAPLFVFIMAEELTRSFLPGYINKLLVPIPGLSPQVVIGLPIVLFMLIVALGQPYLGGWSERVGRRKAMTIGALVATVGFVATAMANSLYDLLLWRSLCAIGYGMVFVAAQGYILDHSGPRDRAKGFALFIGAIMVATVCGPSIGGILADNIGYRLSFAVAAVLAALSIAIIALLPVDKVRTNAKESALPSLREIFGLLRNRRFMTLTGLAAIPAKVMLTGVCFYLVPLFIVSIGSTQSMAGRMLMVYAVLMVLIVPLAASAADRGSSRERLVAAGLCISGLGGFLLLSTTSFWVIFGVVFTLGIGQALSIASQSALVADHCHEEIKRFGSDAVYGVYRLLERLGNALGPLLASVLVIYYDYQGAFIAISALVLICGLLFALLIKLDPPPKEVSA